MKNVKHGYAIVRIDYLDYPYGDHQHTVDTVRAMVIVKRVMWDLEEAKKEVARLNGLNGSDDCKYFCQITRVDI